MTPNCTNTISNMDEDHQEIPLQSKEFYNSGKLTKVVAIYKINKSVLSKKQMSLKTRGLAKVPYSKSSCSRLIFCNQLIKYSVFLVSLWAMMKTEERTLTASPCLVVVELTKPYFINFCLVKNRMGIAANSSVLI